MDMENVVGWVLLFSVPFVLVYSFLKYRAYRARKEQEAFDREFAEIQRLARVRRERTRKDRELFETRAQLSKSLSAVPTKKAVPAKQVESRQVVTDNTDDLVTQTILYNALTSANDTFGANVTYDSNDRPTITEEPVQSYPKSSWDSIGSSSSSSDDDVGKSSSWSSSRSDDSPSSSSSWSSSDSSSSWSSSDSGSSSSWD